MDISRDTLYKISKSKMAPKFLIGSLILTLRTPSSKRTCGAMDNASDYGSEDSRFESWQVQYFFLSNNLYRNI